MDTYRLKCTPERFRPHAHTPSTLFRICCSPGLLSQVCSQNHLLFYTGTFVLPSRSPSAAARVARRTPGWTAQRLDGTMIGEPVVFSDLDVDDDLQPGAWSLDDIHFLWKRSTDKTLGGAEVEEDAGLLQTFIDRSHRLILVKVKGFVGDQARVDGGTMGEPVVQPGYVYLVNEMLVLSMYNVCRPHWLCLGTPRDGQTRHARVLRSRFSTEVSSLGKDAVIDFGIIPQPLNGEEQMKYALAMYIWRFLAELGYPGATFFA